MNEHAANLIKSNHPIALCGDFNVVPTEFDIYDTKSWKKNVLLQPESRAAYSRLLAQGWTDSLRHLFPDEEIYTFWDYFRNHWQKNSYTVSVYTGRISISEGTGMGFGQRFTQRTPSSMFGSSQIQ